MESVSNLPFFFQGQNTYLQYQIKCLHTYFTPIPPTIFLLLLLISNYLFKISTWHFLSYNNFSLTSVHSSFIYFLQVSATRKDFSFSPNRKTNTAFTFSSAAWDSKVAVKPNLVVLWAVKPIKFAVLEYFLHPCLILLQLLQLFSCPL